jgi:sec-independent protein translocase protein TatB
MFNLDPGKLLVIGVVAIILLGPDRLPQVARQLGGAWRSFNEFRHRMESEVRNTMPDLPPTSEIARLARSPSALLNHLSNMSPDDSEDGGGEGDGELPDGSFQPPVTDGANGPAATNGTNGSEPNRDSASGSRSGSGLAGGDSDHRGSPDAPTPTTEPSAAESPPTPAAIRTEHPEPAPTTPGVIVPGDPTLN